MNDQDKLDATATVVQELAQWDDEFDAPKWAAATRWMMARAIVGVLEPWLDK